MVPQLPKLIDGHGLQLPDKPGWSIRPYSQLFTVSAALFTGGTELSQLVSVDAYPDVWARLELFSDALTDQAHPLFERTRDEFFGFLAFLALRDRKNLAVRSVPINYETDRANEFFKTAKRLRPTDFSLCSDTKWDELHLILLNNQPIGITSPFSIICPNEGSHLTALSHVPWCFDGHRFVDPTGRLTVEDALAVSWWIKQVNEKLTTHAAAFSAEGKQWREQLSNLLTQFGGQLSRLARGEEDRNVTGQMSPTGLGMNVGCAFYVAKALKRAPLGIKASMAVIKALRFPAPSKRVLLIDTALGKKFGRPDSAVIVLDGYSLEDIRQIPLGSNKLKIGPNIDLPENVEWRRPEDFFAERLVLIGDSKKAFPGTFEIEGQSAIATKYNGSPIIPLKAELLAYLTPQYIRDNAYFRENNSGIEFGIQLPFENGHGAEISCIYSATPQAGSSGQTGRPIHYETSGIPVVDVWPKFSHPDWKLYFVYWDSLSANVFRVKPHGADNDLRFAERRADGRVEREVFELHYPPDFLLCSIPEKGPDGATRELEAGILMPKIDPLLVESHSDFKIGVDFGTSNTNVYLRKGKDSPEPLKLTLNTLAITAPTPEDREASLYRYFLPSSSEQSPFLSFFNQRPDAPEGTMHPIRHGHILFYNTWNSDDIARDRVKTNLKWLDGHKTAMVAYIQQVCLHASVEAFRQGASAIEWSYSLPTAFPAYRQETLHTIWSNVANWVTTELGIRSGVPLRQTESVAAARYFAVQRKDRAFPRAGATFIDIGGGTSDISIWQNNSLLLQHSIRLSGAQIILAPLYAQLGRVLKTLPADVVSGSRVDELAKVNDQRIFYAKTDALFREFGEPILKWLPKAPDGDKDLKRLIDYVGLGLCGLFYYTGLMIRHLQSEAVPADRRFVLPENGSLPSVHIGGNGSKLFHWAARGEHREDSHINQLFRAMLTTAAGWESTKDELRVSITRQPKAEAAYGLVADYDLKDFDSLDEAAFESVVSGESYSTGDQKRTGFDLITRDSLNRGAVVAKLDTLSHFVDIYNSFATKSNWNLEQIRDKDRILKNVDDSLREWLGQQKAQKDAKKVELEPPFVIGLKELLLQFLGEGER
jgi:hypothetical protein